jgi:hypothetical protein
MRTRLADAPAIAVAPAAHSTANDAHSFILPYLSARCAERDTSHVGVQIESVQVGPALADYFPTPKRIDRGERPPARPTPAPELRDTERFGRLGPSEGHAVGRLKI